MSRPPSILEQFPLRKMIFLCLLWVAALGALTVALHPVMQSSSIGADFFTFWVAEKSLFLDHLNPYSEAVTRASQIGIYGHVASPDQDQVAFAYPVYSLLLIAPTAWMSYPWASSFWTAFNIQSLLAVALLVFFRAPKALIVSSLLFYPIAFGLILGNFAVPLGVILLIVLHSFVTRSAQPVWFQIAAGILLAWSTIKPQFMVFYFAFCVLYAVRRRLWPFLASLGSAMIADLLLAQILVPNWIVDWIRRVVEYTQYNRGQATLRILFSAILPENLALSATWVVIGVIGLFSAMLLAAWLKNQIGDLPLLSWIGLVTYLIHPHGFAYEQLTFLVPFFLWAALSFRSQPRTVILFWTIALVYSWLAFAFGRTSSPIDRSPVLLNAIFVIWLLLQSDWQSIWNEIRKS
ncbi:MAG TPA: glycosyltransferase 87 family protein, partial [Anaerolineaceae bacterium]|nr:glycosyltransferase 87 family protein [Anaerolineaceae bacterium]